MSKFENQPKNSTLRMLLENPQLLELDVSRSHKNMNAKEAFIEENIEYENHKAFLGPTIWQNTIPSEFLDLPPDILENVDVSAWLNEQTRTDNVEMPYSNNRSDICSMEYESNMSPVTNTQSQVYNDKLQFEREEQLNTNNRNFSKNSESSSPTDGSGYDSNSNSGFLGLPITNALKINLPLKAIVGDDSFDPSKRSFTSEELRVAPILPKSQKNFVPVDKKDDHYWTRRLKNNTAAKRSREAKRMKENQITLRTAYLEQENGKLREELAKVNAEKMELKKRLKKYEYVSD